MSDDRVMLLIDADNVSIDIMEQAVRLLLNQHGGVHVRRAYCTAESAVKHQAAFKRLAIKPMVNLAAGKNSTDIALAVDAIDLVLAERPDVVVIASSDSDFAPLVQRLREKGCVVRGIGQKGKTGDETQDVYDDYTVLEHRKAPMARVATSRVVAVADALPSDEPPPPARKAPRKTARKTAAAKAPAAPAAKKAPAKKAAAKKAAGKTSRKTAARKTAAAVQATAPEAAPVVVAAPEPTPEAVAVPVAAQPARKGSGNGGRSGNREGNRDVSREGNREGNGNGNGNGAHRGGTTVQSVLACLPELSGGQGLALNVAVQRLREAQLLGKNSSSLKLFAQLADQFELLPADKPTQVRLRR